MVLNLLISLSQFEREQIGERTVCALNHLRSQGRRVSRHIPFGWDCADGRMLTMNHGEHDTIKRMMEWSASGKSLGEIAQELERIGIRTKNGKGWQRGTVHHILKRMKRVAA